MQRADDVYLLIDECCPRAFVRIAENLGHTAQRTIVIDGLGPQAPDAAIFAFACAVGGIVVTINHDDFFDLASRQTGHPGVIVLPSAGPLVMGRLFTALLRSIERDAMVSGQLIVVDLAGRIARIDVPSSPLG